MKQVVNLSILLLFPSLVSCVQEQGSEAKFISRPQRGGPELVYQQLYTSDIYLPTWQIAYGYASCTASELAKKKRQQQELLDAVEYIIRLWLKPVFDLYRDYPQTPLVEKFNFVERQAVPEVPASFEHHHSLRVSNRNRYQMQIIFYCEEEHSYAAIGKQEAHLFGAPYSPIPEEVADTGYDMLAIAHEIGHLFGLVHTYIDTKMRALGNDSIAKNLRRVTGSNPASVMSLFYLTGDNGKLKLTRDDYLAVQWTHDYYHSGKHRYYPKASLVKDTKDCRFADYKYEELHADNGELLTRGCVPKYPLHFELKQGHLRVAQRMINESPNLDLNLQLPDSGMTAMHYAVILGSVELVSSMLIRKAEVNLITNNDRSTALHYAALFGRQQIAELLLTHPDIKVNAQDSMGSTPLHHAAVNGNVGIVTALIDSPNIKVNLTNNKGNSPLHLAASVGNNEVVVALLSGVTSVVTMLDDRTTAKVRINLRGEDNFSALHYAARNGHAEVVRSLVAQPTLQVNGIDINRKTPLIHAVFNDHVDVVRELLTRDDLDISTFDRSGANALGIASSRDTPESKKIVELLEGN